MRPGKDLVREAGEDPRTPDRPDTKKMTRKLRAEEARGIMRYLIEDPVYLENFQNRMREGRLAPPIEVMVWAYAYGKPKEQVEVTHAAVVRIIHEVQEAKERPIEGEVVKTEALPPGDHGETD